MAACWGSKSHQHVSSHHNRWNCRSWAHALRCSSRLSNAAVVVQQQPTRHLRARVHVNAQEQQQQLAAQQDAFEVLSSLLCPDEVPVELATTELGRGLVAKHDLEPGDTLLTLDAFSTLCVVDEPLRTGHVFGAAVLADWQSIHTELPPLLSAYLQSSRGDWFRRLVAWLLWLKRHGRSPSWALYLQLLPQTSEMCALMNFTPEERAELQLPDLVAAAQQEVDGIRGLHASLFSSSTGELKALDLAPDLSDTLWAAFMVNSRSFSDAAGREMLSLMVPLADMANHSTSPNAAFKLDPASQTFSLTACQAIPAGAEVLISYLGEKPSKSNVELMKAYGFVTPGNINDTISFDMASGEAVHKAPQQLLSPLRLVEASAAAAQSLDSSLGEAVVRQRLQAVLKSLQPFVAQPNSQGLSQQEEEMQLVQQLQQKCQEQLDRAPTSIQQDMQLLTSCQDMPARLQAAIRARVEHKHLLAAGREVLKCYSASGAVQAAS